MLPGQSPESQPAGGGGGRVVLGPRCSPFRPGSLRALRFQPASFSLFLCPLAAKTMQTIGGGPLVQ